MFKDKKPFAIALPITDQYGNDNGIAIVPRDAIASAYYNHNNGQLVINMKQSSINIGSRLLLAEEHTPILEAGKTVPNHLGQPKTRPTGKYRNDVYIQGSGGNEQMVLTDEEEIKRFWLWWEPGIDIEILFSKRKAHLQKVEEYKKQAELRKQEEIKKAEEEVKNKLQTAEGIKAKLRAVSNEISPAPEGSKPQSEEPETCLPPTEDLPTTEKQPQTIE